jgi:hypothetical protein
MGEGERPSGRAGGRLGHAAAACAAARCVAEREVWERWAPGGGRGVAPEITDRDAPGVAQLQAVALVARAHRRAHRGQRRRELAPLPGPWSGVDVRGGQRMELRGRMQCSVQCSLARHSGARLHAEVPRGSAARGSLGRKPTPHRPSSHPRAPRGAPGGCPWRLAAAARPSAGERGAAKPGGGEGGGEPLSAAELLAARASRLSAARSGRQGLERRAAYCRALASGPGPVPLRPPGGARQALALAHPCSRRAPAAHPHRTALHRTAPHPTPGPPPTS